MASDLQSRAGRNWPPFLNQFNELTTLFRKLASKEEIILENPDDRRFTFPSAAVINGSLDSVDAELWLVDDQGNEAVMAAVTLASGDSAQMNAVMGQLAKNEKMLFRITSVPSIFSGIGVRLAPQATIFPGPQNGSVTAIRQLVDDTSIVAEGLPGVFNVGQSTSVSNFGNDGTQTVTASMLFEDGSEIPLSAPVPLPANTVTSLSLSHFLFPNAKLKLQFSNLPNNKYFMFNNDLVIPGNAFEP